MPITSEKQTINNKELSARMLAVQAMYQVLQTGAYLPDVIQEYLNTRISMMTDEGEMERPDGGLFKKILNHLHERMSDIDEIVKSCITKKNDPSEKSADVEPLLRSILLCGVCEILCHTKYDAPIIINDYLDVTHCFYEKSQVSFVNGIFDNAAKALR